MSSWKDRISPADPTNEQLRVTLFIGLGLLHIAAEILSAPPAVETALEAGDPERFRLLFAAEAARCWLVGHGAADSTDTPGEDSASVLASLELARRLARAEVPERQLMDRPAEVVRYLVLRYGLRDQEVMGALFLDARHRLVGEEEIFRGALIRAAVEPRRFIALAICRSTAGLLIFHTHPSGDPSPSPEDVRFTRRMHEACEVVGLQLLDHLILGSSRRWVSLRERWRRR